MTEAFWASGSSLIKITRFRPTILPIASPHRSKELRVFAKAGSPMRARAKARIPLGPWSGMECMAGDA
jgi:hypothetical protein